MASSSFFWSSTGKPFFEGQSMLATVATQTPRNSRGGDGTSPAKEREATASNATRKRCFISVVRSSYCAPKIGSPIGLRESLDRVTQCRPRHGGVVLPQKAVEHRPIALAEFSQHPADGLVNQVFTIAQ